MTIETVELTCPGCGAAVAPDMKVCRYCSSPVIIRTVNHFSLPQTGGAAGNNAAMNMSAAYSFLKARLYDKALEAFDSIIACNFNNSDAHFFAAIAAFKGKRPFLAAPATVKKAEEYLQTAIAIEPKAIYYYFLSYIRLDHHFRKFYKVTPDYKELYQNAVDIGLSQTDAEDLFVNLGVSRPPEI